MRLSEIIARLNSLRHDMEKQPPTENNLFDLETVETCLYYFINKEK